MLPFDYCRERVRSFLKELDRLRDSDFPYRDSRDAIDAIEKHVNEYADHLKAVETDCQESPQNACAEALSAISTCLPLLGFILRSTNVRNSFEVVGPLRRLAQQLLGEEVRLILSSEWLLTPHVYPPIAALPEFVLLGLPSCESSNPLLVPLAGHELGHTAWKSRHIERDYWPVTITDLVCGQVTKREKEYKQWFRADANDLFVRQETSQACVWALRQLEETFCDCVGVRLFAESYLHAFVSMIVPSEKRSFFYPSNAQRFANLKRAATEYGVAFPDDYDAWFTPAKPTPASESREKFLLSLADSAVAALVPDVISGAASLTDGTGVPAVDSEKVKRALAAFRLFVPAREAGSLVNILTAGWEANRDPDFWKDSVNQPEDRTATLFELVLKSIEILEIETVLAG